MLGRGANELAGFLAAGLGAPPIVLICYGVGPEGVCGGAVKLWAGAGPLGLFDLIIET